jgi:hypothetical protein
VGRGGGLTCATVVDGGTGVRSLLLISAPCSSGSMRRPVSIRAGAAMRQGGVRMGCFLASAHCSSAATAVVAKGTQYGSDDDGDDGVPAEATTTGSR